MEYEPVIGLEIHAQLLTKTKIFCGCSSAFGSEPNTHICPLCVGLPGVLPVLNQEVVAFAIKTGLALNCKIAEHTIFARKNYFYPDLPKAYQISQFEAPIAQHGWLEIEQDAGVKRIRIHRVHMEEDAGKLVHQGSATIHGADYSLVDFNRSGVPLIEIVSEPDMSSPEEAKAYVSMLRSILIYLGVCDGNMEEGSLRCDANISLRPKGSDTLGTKTEIKNMNSFRAIERAIQSEMNRQEALLRSGERVVQETRLYSDATGETFSMRSKEEAHDYRYFPEPDLVPLLPDPAWIEAIKASIPELPFQKIKRYQTNLGLPREDAEAIAQHPTYAQFFEQVLSLQVEAKGAANWLLGGISSYLNEHHLTLEKTQLTPARLASLMKLIENGTISHNIAKSILGEILEAGKDPQTIIQEKGLTQIGDIETLKQIITSVITSNPQPVEQYKDGKTQVIGFLVGQVMKKTAGRAKPDLVNKLLKESLQ